MKQILIIFITIILTNSVIAPSDTGKYFDPGFSDGKDFEPSEISSYMESNPTVTIKYMMN